MYTFRCNHCAEKFDTEDNAEGLIQCPYCKGTFSYVSRRICFKLCNTPCIVKLDVGNQLHRKKRKKNIKSVPRRITPTENETDSVEYAVKQSSLE